MRSSPANEPHPIPNVARRTNRCDAFFWTAAAHAMRAEMGDLPSADALLRRATALTLADVLAAKRRDGADTDTDTATDVDVHAVISRALLGGAAVWDINGLAVGDIQPGLYAGTAVEDCGPDEELDEMPYEFVLVAHAQTVCVLSCGHGVPLAPGGAPKLYRYAGPLEHWRAAARAGDFAAAFGVQAGGAPAPQHIELRGALFARRERA